MFIPDAGPIRTALDQAHRQARWHLETGGVVDRKWDLNAGYRTGDLVLPLDVDAAAVGAAIEQAMRRTGVGHVPNKPVIVLDVCSAIVPHGWIRQLGGSDADAAVGS